MTDVMITKRSYMKHILSALLFICIIAISTYSFADDYIAEDAPSCSLQCCHDGLDEGEYCCSDEDEFCYLDDSGKFVCCHLELVCDELVFSSQEYQFCSYSKCLNAWYEYLCEYEEEDYEVVYESMDLC